jgi:hypothetical protein
MSYIRTTWNNNASPSISADNLNNIEEGILENEANIATDETRISTNETNIATNVSGITSNRDRISTNETNIATNSLNINQNTGDIATNTSNISKNTSDIATLSSGETPQGEFTPTAGTEYPSSPSISDSWYIGSLGLDGYTYVTGGLSGETTFNLDKILYTNTGWSLISANLLENTQEYVDDENQLQNNNNFTGYGVREAVPNTERYLESDTANLLTDQIGDSVRVGDGLVERAGSLTCVMPLAPFAPTSTDELLDDKVNGLTCQIAHEKGDIVQTGNELVTNGGFDTDTDWNKGTGWTIGGGVATCDGATGALYQSDKLIVGETYALEFEVTAYTSGTVKLYTGGAGGTTRNSVGVYSEPFVADNVYISIYSALFVGSVDNISVRKTNTTYQAKEDTVDMYDYTIVNEIKDVEAYDVYYNDGTVNTTGITGHYYFKTAFAGSSDLATTDLSLYWTDLGTASNMSLLNPCFQSIPDIVRFDVFGDTATGIKSFKGLHYYDEHFSTDEIASNMGWSKLDNGHYSLPDGTEITNLRLRSTLNFGGEHYVYNEFGRARLDGSTKGGVDTTAVSKYDCFAGALTGGTIASGLAGTDGKYADKVYTEGEGGIIGVGTSISDDVNLAIESSKLNSDVSGISGSQ